MKQPLLYAALVLFGIDAVVTAAPPPRRPRWSQQQTKSPMDDGETLSFKLPARARITGSRGRTALPMLVLQCREKQPAPLSDHEIKAYVLMGVRTSVGTKSVRVRFDTEEPAAYVVFLADGADGVLFVESKDLVKSMTKHARMMVEYLPFNWEPQHATFDLSGIEDVVPKLRSACRWTD
jgi:hypothetical protein